MTSFNLISPLTGKTLILEAATHSLSKKMNTEVVFVMALGEAEPTRENRNKHCEILVSCSNWVDWIDLIELTACM